jgi:hypothetical protein
VPSRSVAISFGGADGTTRGRAGAVVMAALFWIDGLNRWFGACGRSASHRPMAPGTAPSPEPHGGWGA